jgi:hypothetical protein
MVKLVSCHRVAASGEDGVIASVLLGFPSLDTVLTAAFAALTTRAFRFFFSFMAPLTA